jgi:hypothetical protein
MVIAQQPLARWGQGGPQKDGQGHCRADSPGRQLRTLSICHRWPAKTVSQASMGAKGTLIRSRMRKKGA